ncbi:hypothetical protein GTY65_20445 [Streptomyces sp. SID8379]|nr:hypothetical protein [Streptomyces sp. SID8379]MYW66407.1 hypothetical protein [Streptomyces sp. SID8379]
MTLAAALLGAVTLLTPSASASPANFPSHQGGCDPLTGAAEDCLLPFPNDWYTRPDSGTPTGRRVAFTPDMLPRGTASPVVDPTAWNRSDGFSPGSTLVVHVPGLDLTATGAAPLTDIGSSLDRDAPIVLLDTTTGERRPYWAESDANAKSQDRRALLIHPAKNFREGHHYAVALRDLKDAAGHRLPTPDAFAKVAGKKLPRHDTLAARQRQLQPTLRALRHHTKSSDLYLAWDFTVASSQNLTGDLFTIRDDAFRQLGSRSPGFAVTGVKDFTPEQDARIAREVTGTVTVPSYLSLPGGPPGSTLNRGRDGTPRRLPGNVQPAAFRCEIPRTAFTGQPSRPALYGHGLLGSANEVGAGNVKAMAAEHGFTFCAIDWIGMAQADIPVVLGALADLNRFPAVPERTEQGMLDAMFLGRALIHRDGLASDPAFRTEDGRPLIDTAHGLTYDGNSQGGILGGALVAASKDVRRGVLGVTGMNYGLLLNRSADFAPFQQVLDVAYPDRLRQQIVLALYQMVWDRGETNGYAQTLAGSGDRVLMHVAYGDHQVANAAADVEARTLGARLVTPALAPGRSPDRVPYWGIRRAGELPYDDGSAMVVWDSGTPTPPLTNTPPTEPEYGEDPHSDPRSTAAARQQKATFLRTGVVTDVCGGAPCRSLPTP